MDFDKNINRRGTYSTQWDYIEDRFGAGTKDLIPFSISDMDLEVPMEIINTLRKVLEHKIFGYSRWNHSDYKGAVKRWYMKRYKTEIEEEWIVYSPAVIYSISILLEEILEKGEKILTHTPRYDGFNKILTDYSVIDIELKEVSKGEYITDFEKIEKEFKRGVKVFLLCNPENPIGKVWSKKELLRLTNLCEKYNVYLISDDIHMDITRVEVTPIIKLRKEKSIIVSSASKSFNTPGLGGSYAIIPDQNLREQFLYIMKEKHALGSPMIMGMVSTIVAYNECEYWLNSLNKYLSSNCKFVVEELDGYKGIEAYIPDGTYLMWIDFKKTGLSSKEFQKNLIDIGKVAIMSGETYGDSNKIRLNIGCSLSKVKKAVEGIKKVLDSK
ncbi:MAG: MalY/PatB family protein [Cetobacterium sp.]|uniref:MalY/PatB family protein n=1 Tax=Cetobacterium sp. TaxID=2071632 RepID=UPI003EE7368A